MWLSQSWIPACTQHSRLWGREEGSGDQPRIIIQSGDNVRRVTRLCWPGDTDHNWQNLINIDQNNPVQQTESRVGSIIITFTTLCATSVRQLTKKTSGCQWDFISGIIDCILCNSRLVPIDCKSSWFRQNFFLHLSIGCNACVHWCCLVYSAMLEW